MMPFFVDCDPGIDDAVALGYLLSQPDISVVGIAATGGNVSTADIVHNTLAWLQVAGRSDVRVHPGAELPLRHLDDAASSTGSDAALAPASVPDPAAAPDAAAALNTVATVEYADLTHGPTGRGYAELPAVTTEPDPISAAAAWVNAARAYPGELVGVVLGPNTNLALALRMEPDLPRLLKRLFVMGGAFNYRGNTAPTTEWNIDYDPEAAAEVVDAFATAPQLPVFAPLEATETVIFTEAHLNQLRPRPGNAASGAAVSSAEPLADDGLTQEYRVDGQRADSLVADSGAQHMSRPDWSTFRQGLVDALRFYCEFHESEGLGYISQIHDPFVAMLAVGWSRQQLSAPAPNTAPAANAVSAPSAPHASSEASISRLPWCTTHTTTIGIELTGTLTRGETVADWLGRWNRAPNAELVRSIDVASVLDELLTTLQKGPHL